MSALRAHQQRENIKGRRENCPYIGGLGTQVKILRPRTFHFIPFFISFLISCRVCRRVFWGMRLQTCECSSTAEREPSKLDMRVQFPLFAPSCVYLELRHLLASLLTLSLKLNMPRRFSSLEKRNARNAAASKKYCGIRCTTGLHAPQGKCPGSNPGGRFIGIQANLRVFKR